VAGRDPAVALRARTFAQALERPPWPFSSAMGGGRSRGGVHPVSKQFWRTTNPNSAAGPRDRATRQLPAPTSEGAYAIARARHAPPGSKTARAQRINGSMVCPLGQQPPIPQIAPEQELVAIRPVGADPALPGHHPFRA